VNPKDLLIQGMFKVNPYWDEIPWNRQQDKLMRAAGVPPRRTKKITPFDNRPVHVFVVPQHGPSDSRYVAGERNFYFEAAQLLIEILGQSHVTVFEVSDSETATSWIPRLKKQVFASGATHILTHIEIDPGDQIQSWNWDKAMVSLLDSGWDGALLGVNFDSAFKWIRAKSRRLARISPQFLAVDICMPLDGELVSDRVEVGPVNMPMSHASLNLVDKAISQVHKVNDVSFIGVLYPYRIELIERLRARGLNVAVNPHRADSAIDSESSRTNQPSWLDYMRGLASSHMTINFSQSSAGPFEQLKTRVLEATLAGTYLLTDDQDRTRLFFQPAQFSTFNSVDELPGLIESLLSDREALDARARSAQERARELAVTDFWTRIDRGLKARGLPQIFLSE
jgi:hypothetical protein